MLGNSPFSVSPFAGQDGTGRAFATAVEASLFLNSALAVANSKSSLVGQTLNLTLGEENVTAASQITVTGEQLALSLDDVTVKGKVGFTVNDLLLSISLEGYNVSANTLIEPTGFTITSSIGSLLFWTSVIDDQFGSYSVVNANPVAGNYLNVNSEQVNLWTEVASDQSPIYSDVDKD